MMGLSRHVCRLPMSFKSCFYPLLGSRTFGWLGDLIDAGSSLAVMIGISIALAIACIQLSAGINVIIPGTVGLEDWKIQVGLCVCGARFQGRH